MNAFLQLTEALDAVLAEKPEHLMAVDRPLDVDGVWFLSIGDPEGYGIEIEWNRHRGFGLVAGWNLGFGTGVDEVFGSMDAVLARVRRLLATPVATSGDKPVDLVELRKLCGAFQKDVAAGLGISKSGLAQLEKRAALPSMQVDTLQRIVSVLGGNLVITAEFPHGRTRRIDACGNGG